jgi:hypothetical protein
VNLTPSLSPSCRITSSITGDRGRPSAIEGLHRAAILHHLRLELPRWVSHYPPLHVRRHPHTFPELKLPTNPHRIPSSITDVVTGTTNWVTPQGHGPKPLRTKWLWAERAASALYSFFHFCFIYLNLKN